MEKRELKAARRRAREARNAAAAEAAAEVSGDPDLAGIVAGPQPVREDPLDRRSEEER